jgi:hypothetical protein
MSEFSFIPDPARSASDPSTNTDSYNQLDLVTEQIRLRYCSSDLVYDMPNGREKDIKVIIHHADENDNDYDIETFIKYHQYSSFVEPSTFGIDSDLVEDEIVRALKEHYPRTPVAGWFIRILCPGTSENGKPVLMGGRPWRTIIDSVRMVKPWTTILFLCSHSDRYLNSILGSMDKQINYSYQTASSDEPDQLMPWGFTCQK